MLRLVSDIDAGTNEEAERLLNDAMDYFASELPPRVDPRAWQHLLIYAPTSVLVRALVKRLYWRWVKPFLLATRVLH
jgi:hypothetical protein